MKSKRTILFTILMMTVVCIPLMSQSPISGVVNSYTPIEELLFRSKSDVANAVRVSSTAGFSVKDTVMVYITKGFKVDRGSPGDPGDISILANYDHTGKYTFLIIDSIKFDTIVFNNSTGFDFAPDIYRPLDAGERAQLIRVPSYESARVTSALVSQPWDSATNTGGVLALFVKGKLKLEAPINVTGQGFTGGDPSAKPDDYGNSGCYSDDPAGYGKNFYTQFADDSSGLKGEGAGDATFRFIRGRSKLINGGGGGNGRYSGGGGGANYGAGGDGGNESDLCASVPGTTNGKGGFKFPELGLYKNLEGSSEVYANRVFLGGGGGSGTQDPGFPASRGGNGGGVVIIIADTLEGIFSTPILARGESVSNPVAGAGAGGGGGGCIVLEVSHYMGTIHLDAEGGAGGNTNGADYSGPGGGGGGGIYWMRRDSANITREMKKGARGKYGVLTQGQAGEGDIPGFLTGLKVPLDGFLFNTLPNDRTVCSDETPLPIDATAPKGGDESNTNKKWYYKPDMTSTWIYDPSHDDKEDYTFSTPLTVTTSYMREVISGSLHAYDSITLTVLPRIVRNHIMAHDTVCFGLPALPFGPDSIIGGADIPSNIRYRWLRSTDGGTNWFDATGVNDQEGYASPGLNETTTFARIAKSGVCDDTSNSVIVTVLPSIAGNSIDQDTTLCYNMQPDTFTGDPLSGGDGAGTYSYRWIESNNATTFSDPTETSNAATFSADQLKVTTYYQRIVYSGSQDACIDTSNMLTITILPDITNNIIKLPTTDTTICEELSLDDGIDGAVPVNGESGDYRYTWLQSPDGAAWTTASGTADAEDYSRGPFSATTYYVRWVRSGPYNVCQDTTPALKVTVVPKILNNVMLSESDTICQGINSQPYLASLPLGGGNGTFEYIWEFRKEGTSKWDTVSIDAPPVNDTLHQSTYVHRKVYSPAGTQVCTSFTDSILIKVQNRITHNTLIHDPGYICKGQHLTIIGPPPGSLDGGDESTYTFIWEDSISGGAFTALAITTNYDEDDYQSERFFRRIVNSGVCERSSNILQMPVRELPTGKLTLADASNIYCSGDQVTLQVEDTAGLGTAPYTFEIEYIPDDGGSPFSESGKNSVDLIIHSVETETQTTFTYTMLSVEDANGCFSLVEGLTGSVDIDVYPSPDVEILTHDNIRICGDSVELSALPTADYYLKQWSTDHPSFSWINETADNATAIVSRNGLDSLDVTFEWKIEIPGGADAPACSDSVNLTVSMFERPREDRDSIDLKLDTVPVFVQEQYDLKIQTRSLDAGTQTWENIGTIGEVSSDGVTTIDLPFVFGESQYYNFRYTVKNGKCGPYADDVTIARHELKLYDGFSPDGDGRFNDAFAARGLEYAVRFDCYIYNSWGTLVKYVDQTDLAELGTITDDDGIEVQVLWKGSRKDDETSVSTEEIVDDGIYFYKINTWMTTDPDEEPYPLTGSIILKTR